MTRIVVFSGGRGTRYIQEALSGVECEVAFLINGYDSGLSTGRIRWAFDGMLGPSDFRKCIAIALAQGSPSSRVIGRLLEDREITMELATAYRMNGQGAILAALAQDHPGLEIGTFVPLSAWLREFFDSEPVADGLVLRDMPLGNALFAGAYLQQGSSFNDALDVMQRALLEGSRVSICDVTKGEDLWLAARTHTHLTVDEGTIVGGRPPGPITELMLLPRAVARQLWESYGGWAPLEPSIERLLAGSRAVPELSDEAHRAIAEADLIVFGSGTQHSSILPSYLTQGLSSAIAANRTARKLLFVNGTRDLDFHTSERVQDLLDKARALLVTPDALPFSSLVTGIHAATLDWDRVEEPSGSAVEIEAHGIPVTNAARPVLNATDAYSGFAAALAQEMGHVIAPSSTVVSVVVPVLNEVGTLPELLRQMESLTQIRGLSVERVVVDGGSTDGSWELIQSCPWVAGYQADGRMGRAACILEGVHHSRGEQVCVFHADLEYQLSDIEHLAAVGIAYPDSLTVGSRGQGAGSERNLRRMYGGKGILFWTARLGGILVAALLSLRLGRMISDPFCGLFTARREVLLECLDGSGGIDSNVRMLLRARRREHAIVEAGVSFSPRTREAGKKTTVTDGLRALAAALVMPARPSVVDDGPPSSQLDVLSEGETGEDAVVRDRRAG